MSCEKCKLCLHVVYCQDQATNIKTVALGLVKRRSNDYMYQHMIYVKGQDSNIGT